MDPLGAFRAAEKGACGFGGDEERTASLRGISKQFVHIDRAKQELTSKNQRANSSFLISAG